MTLLALIHADFGAFRIAFEPLDEVHHTENGVIISFANVKGIGKYVPLPYTRPGGQSFSNVYSRSRRVYTA